MEAENSQPEEVKIPWKDMLSMGALGIAVITAALALGFAVIAVPMMAIAGELGLTDSPATVVADSGDVSVDDSALPGETVATNAGCLACHTTDGSDSAGPTWLGLAGSERTFDDGTTAVADEAYLEAAILDPGSQVVDGFNAIMPATYGDSLSEQEIADLIDYLESLSG